MPVRFVRMLLPLLCLLAASIGAVKITNFPARQIRDYRRYDDVTILHYKFPEQIQTAIWNFTAWEVKQSISISSCKPRPMTAVLKQGGYPVVNPDGSKFPDLYFVRNETLSEVLFSSDKKSNYLTITNPLPGDWFAIVFNNYTDPDDDEIVQSGLTLVCTVVMEASIDVTAVEMVVLTAQQSSHHVMDAATTAMKFKIFVPINTSSVHIELTMISSEGSVHLTSTAPTTVDRTLGLHCLGNCSLHFIPTEHSWYYLMASINSTETPRVEFDLAVKMTVKDDETCNTTSNKDFPVCWSTVPLTRQTYSGFFTYGFERTPFENGTLKPVLQVSTVKPTLLSFDVNPIQDIGGTLSFEITIVLEGLKPFLDKFEVKVLACVSHELHQLPQFPDQCLSCTGSVSPSQLFVNTSSESNKTHTRRLHIPFPESGRWFLSLLPFCYHLTNDTSVETPCTGVDAVNMTFVVESDSSDPDACGQYGRCLTHMNGGLMFSTCNCRRGYRGWGCTDNSKVTSQYELLVASLLLTLSNLFFFPAIVISIRRGYYTEALVYSFTMLFSTFYHACDAGEDIYSYCIIRSSVLQFCDFYSAVLAVWVTIIAMANLAPWLCSLAHMAGAVIIALGAENNRTSLWMFLLPTLCGLAILSFTWGIRMRRTRSCYPKKKYWKIYLPIGLVLIFVGLVCFAFLETTKNYKYVHSFWHAIMAISILVVLPIRDLIPTTVIPDDIEQERVEIPEEAKSEDNPSPSPSFKSKWYMFWASLRR